MKLVYHDTEHSYFLDGKRVKSASKVARIASDGFAIEQWRDRQLVIGMTLDRSLAEQVAMNIDNDKAVQKVCKEAEAAAKADARARRGSQRHRALELLLLGRTDRFVSDQQRADAVVLERTLERYGLTPMPDRVEQFVVWPDHGVVGRYDAVVGYRGGPVLVDLKGGPNAVKYPQSTCVQMTLYAHAPTTSRSIDHDGDVYTATEWTTMPDGLDVEYGYVIYCDDDHDVGELWRIDLAGGRPAADLALEIVQWRKRHDYGRALASPVDEPPADRRGDLLSRFRAMSQDEQDAFRALHIDPDDLDAVEAGLEQVDAFNVRAEPANVDFAVATVPPTPPDEGAAVDVAEVMALSARYAALGPEAKAWTGALVSQGNETFRWRMSESPTVRRFEIYRGVMALAEWSKGNADNVVRAILAMLVDDTAVEFPTVPVGAALGLLDAEQAGLFAQIACRVANDQFALVIHEDGTPVLVPA